MTEPNFTRRLRNRKSDFKPDRIYIEDAVAEYLKRGGKITRLEIGPFSPEIPGFYNSVDSFLMGV